MQGMKYALESRAATAYQSQATKLSITSNHLPKTCWYKEHKRGGQYLLHQEWVPTGQLPEA